MWRAHKKIVIVCVIAGFLAVISTALGLAAEATRLKLSQVKEVSPDSCSHPTTPAYALGMASAFLLLIAQLVISWFNGCLCGIRPNALSINSSFAHLWLSWYPILIFGDLRMLFWFAFLILLGGAALNNKNVFRDLICYVVAPGMFSLASMSGFASVSISILYYLTISGWKSQFKSPVPPNESHIAMEQVPPTSHDPAFIHEDT